LLICGNSIRLHSTEILKLSICTDMDEQSIRNIKCVKDLETLLSQSVSESNSYPELKLLRAIYLPELRSSLKNNVM